MADANILESLFKKVIRDGEGYEDVDDFWEAAHVLKFPLIKPLQAYLNKCSDDYMLALTGNRYTATETDPGNSTDDDFDYEDNESFTDASDDASLVSEDAQDLDASIALTPETRKSTRSSVGTTATKDTLGESLPLEDTVNNTTFNSTSRRVSRSQYSADESNNNISAITSVNTPAKGSGSVAAKGRGRSSVGLNDSGTTVQPNSSQDEASSPDSKSLNTTAASTRSSRNQTRSTRQSDSEEPTENESRITPVSKTSRSTRSAPNTMDTNLSAPFSAEQPEQQSRTPGRRVSFGPSISPIGRGSSSRKRASIGSINDPSTDVSRASSDAASATSGNDYDAYDNEDNGGMYFQDNNEPEDDRMASMQSDVETPQTNKSLSRTGRSSANTTPASAGGRSANTSRASSANRSRVSSSSATPRTPDSLHLSQIDTPKTGELYRGITLPDESYVQEDEDTDREEDASNLNTTRDSTNTSFAADESSFVDNSFLFTISEKNPNYFGNKDEAKTVLARKSNAISSKKRKSVYTSDEEEPANDLGINSDDDSDDGGRRRSRRATKGQKFAFWKNERPIYDHGTLVGINAASKTPVKPKSKSKLSRGGRSKTSKKLLDDVEGEASEEEEEEVKPKLKESVIKLPKDVKYIERDKFDEIQTWNEVDQDVVQDVAVVRRVEELTAKELKPSRKRAGGKSVNCLAVQALSQDEPPDGSMSAWVSGNVLLPPRAIKDEEQVGKFNMIFVLAECQNDAVELAIANPESNDWDSATAQRMLLKKGDTFCVPPGNIYRLENHSSTIPATLYFTIIKPIESTLGVQSSGAAEAVY